MVIQCRQRLWRAISMSWWCGVVILHRSLRCLASSGSTIHGNIYTHAKPAHLITAAGTSLAAHLPVTSYISLPPKYKLTDRTCCLKSPSPNQSTIQSTIHSINHALPLHTSTRRHLTLLQQLTRRPHPHGIPPRPLLQQPLLPLLQHGELSALHAR